MAVLGAGETGKSTLIEAIRTWFRRNGRGKESQSMDSLKRISPFKRIFILSR